jgi:hypothetical protein
MLKLRKVILMIVVLCSMQTMVQADDDRSNKDGIVQSLKKLYGDLPPHGKMATGAFVGFASSRVAVKTAVGGLKMAGAAFIV